LLDSLLQEMMKLGVIFSALLLSVVCQDCENSFPDGSDCSVNNGTHVSAVADDCTSFWKCSSENCPTITKCERNYLFSSELSKCTDNTQVDCGSRPCMDPMHCPSEHPTTPMPTNSTTTPTPDTNMTTTLPETTTNECDHSFDCKASGDGWFADEFNCRKYWHCFEDEGEHMLCPEGQLYDPVNVWCNWNYNVDCGDRPICGACDTDCEETTTRGPTTTHATCTHECTADGLFEEGCCENAYCQCFGGIGYVQHCSADLVFNTAVGTCDFQFNVPCCNA
jgi:hypothetical protein